MIHVENQLRNGNLLVVCEATIADAKALIDFANAVSLESDFLTFGPGEFGLSLEDEITHIQTSRDTANRLFIIGKIDEAIITTLNFAAGRRPRTQHSGAFSMSVRKSHWGLGIGGLMVDTLITWARGTGIIKKINLCVRTDNKRAVHLYQGKNFIIEGTLQRELFIKDTYFDVHHMGLLL